MRRVVWVVLVLALVWSGWWYWAASAGKAAVDRWLADRRAEGWQAEYGALDVSGFPAKFDAHMALPALADPETGVAITASGMDISAPAWWPGNLTVTLPEDAITFASPTSRATLLMDQALAQLQLHPGKTLELEALSLDAGPWSLNAPLGQVVSADDARLSFVQQTAGGTRYTLKIDAAALRPGSVPRSALRVPESWPVTFDRFALNMDVGFNRVWDLSAVEVARPQPRLIRIALAEAAWGTLELRAAADLTVDEQGVPAGTLSLQARNWQDMLVLAEAAGALPPALVPQAQSVLSALAQATGDPQAIDITITVRNGLMLIGFLPIGPAPRLILR